MKTITKTQANMSIGCQDIKKITTNLLVLVYINPEHYEVFKPNNLQFDDAQKIERLARNSAQLKVRTRLTRQAILFTVS